MISAALISERKLVILVRWVSFFRIRNNIKRHTKSNRFSLGYHFNSLDHRSMIFCKHLFLCPGGCHFGKVDTIFPVTTNQCLDTQCGRDYGPSTRQKQKLVDSVLDNLAISGTIEPENVILPRDYDAVLDEMNRKLSYNEQCRLAHTELT